MAADKMPRGDQPPLTAIATTEPNCIAMATHMTEAYNGQTIKSLTSKGLFRRHKGGPLMSGGTNPAVRALAHPLIKYQPG